MPHAGQHLLGIVETLDAVHDSAHREHLAADTNII